MGHVACGDVKSLSDFTSPHVYLYVAMQPVSDISQLSMCGMYDLPWMEPEEGAVLYYLLADSELLATTECSTTLALSATFISSLVGSAFIPYL